MSPHTYAGWFVIDLRLFVFVTLISLFTSLGLLALFFQGKHWHEYVTAFVSLFLLVMCISILVFNQLASYPVFLIEDVFPFP